MPEKVFQRIMESLRDDMKSTTEISEDLDVDRTYVSGSLQVMCELDVVERKCVGTNKIYRLKEEQFENDAVLEELVQ